MNKICTSIEQSQRLIELGIDINTADMDYIPVVNIDGEYSISVNVWDNDHVIEEGWIPAWSLSALLELTPNDVSLLHFEDAYQAVYDVKPYYITNKSDNPFGAVFEMVCWLKENEKI